MNAETDASVVAIANAVVTAVSATQMNHVVLAKNAAKHAASKILYHIDGP